MVALVLRVVDTFSHSESSLSLAAKRNARGNSCAFCLEVVRTTVDFMTTALLAVVRLLHVSLQVTAALR